jgi:hypothetical protein
MTDWRKIYWRFRNAILTFGAEGPLGKLGTFVSPLLVVGIVVVSLSVVFVQTSGFGPCGPNSTWGWFWFFSLMVGLAVICIGLVLSAVKTLKYFWLRMRHKPNDKV